MYYHSRALIYVSYGKVFPQPTGQVDPDFAKAYQWLGKYCGFCPQIWLSRSTSQITGMRNSQERILFGFEQVQGFPVRMRHWDFLLSMLMNNPPDAYLITFLDTMYQESIAEHEQLDEVLQDWEKSENLEDFLQRFVFVERDQVVVPSLNLKSAKTIACRDEFQKKKLRRMGFIEDRISIRRIRTF